MVLQGWPSDVSARWQWQLPLVPRLPGFPPERLAPACPKPCHAESRSCLHTLSKTQPTRSCGRRRRGCLRNPRCFHACLSLSLSFQRGWPLNPPPQSRGGRHLCSAAGYRCARLSRGRDPSHVFLRLAWRCFGDGRGRRCEDPPGGDGTGLDSSRCRVRQGVDMGSGESRTDRSRAFVGRNARCFFLTEAFSTHVPAIGRHASVSIMRRWPICWLAGAHRAASRILPFAHVFMFLCHRRVPYVRPGAASSRLSRRRHPIRQATQALRSLPITRRLSLGKGLRPPMVPAILAATARSTRWRA